MFNRKRNFGIFCLLCLSSLIISEASKNQLKKLEKNQKRILKKIDHVIELLEPEETGVGPVVFKISIKNEINQKVIGRIVYDDNVHHAEQYLAPAFSTFNEKISPPEPIIKNITGITESGIICDPYELKEDEDPKFKFHIVAKEDEGCIILPAKEQYHPVNKFSFHENDELVQQEDFFNPGTREAILKVAAHGNNPKTTMIFQTSKSTKQRRNAGFGIMVTASGDDCHITELPDELNIDPEHMTFKWSTESEAARKDQTLRTVDKNIQKYHIVKHLQNTQVIDPDSNEYKSLLLTETQKKECEGKTIFYNTEHIVIPEEEFTTGIISSIKEEESTKYKKFFNGTAKIDDKVNFPCVDASWKYSNAARRSCGVWTYTGVDSTTGNEPNDPFTNMDGTHIYSGTWQVIAGCCNDKPNDSDWFPCDGIPEGAGDDAEQRFSTAFYLSWKSRGFSCPGKSKFCQAEENSDLYQDLGVTGACTSTCTECCSWSGGQKNACPKSYGWYFGFYKNACSKQEYLSGR